eukprot:TRINITY_DN36216_c2_g2_i2.p1 TRINITY_DN36216_c2_g2~~TRINITY_DN36216_c2_g2_i2.p1  ORF type:complete len:288 (+),score=75.57 TRINITY_DN36216_c2_g2_i2:212-1075(+)
MTYPDMIFDMVRKVSATPGVGAERDAASAVELGSALFEHCTTPVVDGWLPRYFDVFSQRLGTAETTDLKKAILLSFATMLWYNAELFLRCTEEKGCTRQVFEVWMQRINIIRSLHDRKVMLLGKVRIFQLGCVQGLPESVVAGLPHLLHMVALQSKEIIRLRQKKASGEDTDSDEETESEDDAAGKPKKIDQVLNKLAMAQEPDSDEDEGDDVDEDDDLYGLSGDDDILALERPSPLDKLDELGVLRDALMQAPPGMQQQIETWIGGGLQQWVSELSSEVSRKAAQA